MTRSQENLVAKAYSDPRYRGKRIVILHGKIFPSPVGAAGFRKLQSLLKRYAGETPTIVYVPKAEALILLGS